MKKIALLLALCMLISAFVSCNGADNNNDQKKDENPGDNAGQNDENQDDGETGDDDDQNGNEDNSDQKPDDNDNNEIVDDGKFLEENAEDFAKEFAGYEKLTVENSRLQSGELVLVDSTHTYADGDTSKIVRIKDYDSNGFPMVASGKTKLDFVTLRKLQEMNSQMNAALNVNYLYCVQSGYLTCDELDALHESYPNEYPEKGGESDLNTGYAVTVSVYVGSMNHPFRRDAVSHIAAWTEENAHKYGFVFVEDVGENAQLRYVGVAHATYMYENELSLSQYLALLKNGEKLQITDHRDLTWTVYRVEAAAGDATEIDVPTGMVYSVSGDNNGGFIVTVKGICQ